MQCTSALTMHTQHAKLPTSEEFSATELDGSIEAPSANDGVWAWVPKTAAGCCSAINPETSLLRMAWDCFLLISVLYTVLVTFTFIVFMEPEQSVKVETESAWCATAHRREPAASH